MADLSDQYNFIKEEETKTRLKRHYKLLQI